MWTQEKLLRHCHHVLLNEVVWGSPTPPPDAAIPVELVPPLFLNKEEVASQVDMLAPAASQPWVGGAPRSLVARLGEGGLNT